MERKEENEMEYERERERQFNVLVNSHYAKPTELPNMFGSIKRLMRFGLPEGSVSNHLVVYCPFPQDRLVVPNDIGQVVIRQERYFARGLDFKTAYDFSSPWETNYEDGLKKHQLPKIIPGFDPYILITGEGTKKICNSA